MAGCTDEAVEAAKNIDFDIDVVVNCSRIRSTVVKPAVVVLFGQL